MKSSSIRMILLPLDLSCSPDYCGCTIYWLRKKLIFGVFTRVIVVTWLSLLLGHLPTHPTVSCLYAAVTSLRIRSFPFERHREIKVCCSGIEDIIRLCLLFWERKYADVSLERVFCVKMVETDSFVVYKFIHCSYKYVWILYSNV